ncbi:cytochrome P450 [Flagelloscypha sp. PMI_526]|nr:cytochrome P450 [Flagelloscypha sp. PMI_526]
MYSLSLSETAVVSTSILLLYTSVSWFISRYRRLRLTTSLPGPPRVHWLWGWSRVIARSDTVNDIYDGWIREYGSVFSVPTMLWGRRILLTDPKAVTHFYAHDPVIYGQGERGKVFVESFLGKTLLTAGGEHHKRLRKTLSPAFSMAAVRRATEVFYDSAHKVKTHWQTIVDSNDGEAIIEVQEWMNHVSLDTIGIAGFGHDFGSLDGKKSTIAEMLGSFSIQRPTLLDLIVILLSIPFPNVFIHVPCPWNRRLSKFRRTMVEAAQELLATTKQEAKVLGSGSAVEKSMIGLLIKAESTSGSLKMTVEEVTDQMNLLIFAGYETTSISLTWAIIELARNPHKQAELRAEVAKFSSDATYEQLASSSVLPCLDVVAHEVLRLHAPLFETVRVVKSDDILPLSKPITTSAGDLVDHLTIAKGTDISVPISTINCSPEFWGPDAKEFKPSRWLDLLTKDIPAKEIQCHRHLLTFSDGPRTCIGKTFALVEFKAVLFVLIRTFMFEFPRGSDSAIECQRSIFFKRPRLAGEEGFRVPLRIRRV